MQDANLPPCIEHTAEEAAEYSFVGSGVRRSCRAGQRRRKMHRPFAGKRIDHGYVRVGLEISHEVTGLGQFAADAGYLVVDPPGFEAVGKDASPVGLGAEVEGVPVPVLDGSGSPGDKGPRCLTQLPVVLCRASSCRGRALTGFCSPAL